MPAAISYVDVVVPLPLPKMLTYSLEGMEQAVELGMRVVVQVGTKKRYTAVVWRVHDQAPTVYAARPIDSLVDEYPVVVPRQRALWEWMADYYLCTRGEVMAAALPAGLKLSSQTRLVVHPDRNEADVRALDVSSQLLYDAIFARQGMTIQEAAKLLDVQSPQRAINRLVDAGLILSEEELKEINKIKQLSLLNKMAKPFVEIREAVKEMPKFMWKISAVYLFQWYALFVYWQFSTPLFIKTMGYSISEAGSQSAAMSLTYNTTTMLIALILVPLTLKFGNKKMYALSLLGTAIALFWIPFISDPFLVLIPMILFGIGWAAMMGIPYTMVSKIVPQERRGVYMGILNMMIVIPMGIETLTFGPIYKYLLDGNAIYAILFAGVFFAIAAFLALRLNETSNTENNTE